MHGTVRRCCWAVCLMLGTVLTFGCSSDKASDSSLTVVSFGGAYQAAQSDAYMKPFAESKGVQVSEGDYNGDYGILKNRATVPRGVWDVVSVEAVPTARGSREGIFLEIPERVYQGLNLVPGAKGRYGAGHLVFSTILAYSTRVFPDPKDAPASWEDFWNLEKFPGKRALRNSPRGTLEIALLGAGIEPAALYPLDVELAFERLDILRPHLVFWEAGAQPPQLLATRTVVMTSAYNGRVWNARVNENADVSWTLNQGLMETEFWVVPKNAPHPELAFDFIEFSLGISPQARFANIIAYGPVNLDALAQVSEEIKGALPNSPQALCLQVPVNFEWWAHNQANIERRWEEWQTGD